MNPRTPACPLCESDDTELFALVRLLTEIVEKRQCSRCGETFVVDDDGIELDLKRRQHPPE